MCDLCLWSSDFRNCSFAFLPLASFVCPIQYNYIYYTFEMVVVVLWTLRLRYIHMTVRGVLNAFMIIMIPGLLMALDRRQFYGNAWKYRYMQGVEKSYLPGSLRLGEVLVAGSW